MNPVPYSLIHKILIFRPKLYDLVFISFRVVTPRKNLFSFCFDQIFLCSTCLIKQMDAAVRLEHSIDSKVVLKMKRIPVTNFVLIHLLRLNLQWNSVLYNNLGCVSSAEYGSLTTLTVLYHNWFYHIDCCKWNS